MADSKRGGYGGGGGSGGGGVASRVATPKTTSTSTTSQAAPMGDTFEALGKAIGARLRLTTAAPHAQTYEGSLFTACPILNVVALNTRSTSTSTSTTNPPSAAQEPGDYSIIPISSIQSFQLLSLASPSAGAAEKGGKSTANPTSFTAARPAIGQLDLKRLRAREADAIRKRKDYDNDRGRGVTKEAQAIFDSFKRINLPIRWHNQEMIVHEAVIITPPYRAEDCKGAKEKQEVLNRVRKVLEGERRKIREREEREKKEPTTAGVATGSEGLAGPRKGG